MADPIDRELNSLVSKEDHRRYLEQIFEQDQALRQGQSAEIMLQYGKASKEFENFLRLSNSQDSLNLVKIERYLKRFGHPEKNEVGEIAAQTPWAVIHHAPTEAERERNFEYLYQAYLDGNLDENAMSFYLGRMYQIRFRRRLAMQEPYTQQDAINEMIRRLGLEERAQTVFSK